VQCGSGNVKTIGKIKVEQPVTQLTEKQSLNMMHNVVEALKVSRHIEIVIFIYLSRFKLIVLVTGLSIRAGYHFRYLTGVR